MKLHEADRLLHIGDDFDRLTYTPSESLDTLLHRTPFRPSRLVNLLPQIPDRFELNTYDQFVLTATLQDALLTNAIKPERTSHRKATAKATTTLQRQSKKIVGDAELIQSVAQSLAEELKENSPNTSKSVALSRYFFGLKKFWFFRELMASTLDRFVQNPNLSPTPNHHLRHIRDGLDGAVNFLPLLHYFETKQRTNRQDVLLAEDAKTTAGLIHELDIFFGLSDFFNARRIHAWIFPTFWPLESGFTDEHGYHEGLDFIVYRPDIQEIFGIQAGLTKMRGTNPGVVTINANDIGNIRGGRIKSGEVIGALAVARGLGDMSQTSYDRSFKPVNFANAANPNRNVQVGKQIVRAIRDDIQKVILDQAPTLLLDEAA